MSKRKLIVASVLVILNSLVSVGICETTIRLKATVEPLEREIDITDNVREITVTTLVKPQETKDLAVTDISISPVSITTSTWISAWVTVKNKGNEMLGDGVEMVDLGNEIL